MKSTLLAFALLGLLSAPSRAEMVVTGVVSSASTTSFGNAGLGDLWDPEHNYDETLRTSDFAESNSHIGSTDPRGTTVSSSGHSELFFDINAPAGTILAGGRIAANAHQSSALIDRGPDLPPLVLWGHARTTAHSVVELFFTLTTTHRFSLEAFTRRTDIPDFGNDNSEIAFTDSFGNNLLSASQGTIFAHGLLLPGTYYLTGFVGSTADTSCCLLESSASIDNQWGLSLAITPVPLPAGIWLLASALCGLLAKGGLRRPVSA